MTRYIIVNPHDRTIKTVQSETLVQAQQKAGLDGVDHGALSVGRPFNIGYCVYELAFYTSPQIQAYFSIGNLLFAGAAVFYGFDEAGETLDMRLSEFPNIRWYLGSNDVESAIENGDIDRPIMSVNDDVIWQWPDPAPDGLQ